MERRQTPIYSACLNSLRDLVVQGHHQEPSGRLPTVRELAARTGASVFTVSRALRQLQLERAVVVVRGQGVFTPEQAALRRRQPATSGAGVVWRAKWQDLREQIERDLLTGLLGHDLPIPSVRDLAQRYAVSAPTVRRALRAITASGTSVARALSTGTGTAVPLLARSSLLLVTEADLAGAPVFVNRRNHDFFWQLERECARRGLSVRLHTVAPGHLGGDHVHHVCGRVQQALTDRPYAAIAVVAAGFEDPNGLLAGLRPTGLPVAVLDERERVSRSHAVTRRAPVCVVAMESSEVPGLRVGRLLRSRGHRHVAFFTDATGGAWSVQRLEGVRSAVSAGQESGTVTEYGTVPSVPPEVAAGLRRAVASYGRAMAGPHVARFEQHQAGFEASESLRAAMAPLLEQALAHRYQTAWVGVHDPVALLALDFLASRRVRVPRDVAVVGFDNYLEAQQHDLTSYDFGFERAVHAIVSFACQPRAPLFARNGGRVAIEGAVVQRGSTG